MIFVGLFEDVVINAKSAVSVVGKKAGEIVDISKLRITAADLNNEISKRFESLGRVIYDAKKTENDTSDLVTECISAIDDLYEQLDAVNEQIIALRKKTICRNCGAINPQDSVFCSKCGNRLVNDGPSADENSEGK